MRSSSNETRKNVVISEFTQEFISKTKEFVVTTRPENNQELFCKEIESTINEMKPLRDSFLDFFKELILSENNVTDFFCRFMEELYNNLLLLKISGNSYSNYDEAMLEHYQIFIWNIFVSSITYLRHYEKYKEINIILTTTYFLIYGITSLDRKKPESFLKFRCYSRLFDGFYSNRDRLFSKTADVIVLQNKEPLLTSETFSQSDIFLSQMSFALKTSSLNRGWFALSYVYAKNTDDIWLRLSSKKYCEKILPLFGVYSIDELIKLIKENPVKDQYGYQMAWNSIPKIPLKIYEYEIASLQ